MQNAIIALIAVLSAYFFLAAFYRPLRIRYGISSVTTIYPKRVTKQHYGKPRMGGLFCLGVGLFLAGFPVLYFGISKPPVPSIVAVMMVIGGAVALVGQSRDRSSRNTAYKPRKRDD